MIIAGQILFTSGFRRIKVTDLLRNYGGAGGGNGQ